MPTPDYGPFYYVQLPQDFPVVGPDNSPPIVTSMRILVEHALVDWKAFAQRCDLYDNRRIYRVHEAFLWMLPKDQYGRYVWAGVAKERGPMGTPVMKKLYWSPTNPITANDVIVRDWVLLE